jgi:hypothetical protein
MRLVDRVAQCRTPFIAVCNVTGTRTRLSGASDHAIEVATCPTRYVLSDDLTRLCAALAFSKGAQTLTCTDLIRIPAETLWVEWAHAPWSDELDRCGFPAGELNDGCGRRGAILNSSRDGRRGYIRAIWCMRDGEDEVFASPLEAKFDLDAAQSVTIGDGASTGSASLSGNDCARYSLAACVFSRPRLHHVHSHIVRRRNELFWRMPHLRGNAGTGVLKSRTVTWAFDQSR